MAIIMPKKRPTHFLSLPLYSNATLKEFQTHISNFPIPGLKLHNFTKPETFHITLGVLHLPNLDYLFSASMALQNFKLKFSSPFNLLLKFSGLGVFGEPQSARVLKLGLQNTESKFMLESFHAELMHELVKSGACTYRDLASQRVNFCPFEFSYHLTLAKTKFNKRFDATWILENYEDAQLGYFEVNRIQLCRMDRKRSKHYPVEYEVFI